MLFFLKMDKQLRLPVFVLALIIIAGIGILPCKADDEVECYVCEEPNCAGKTEKCKKNACKTSYTSGGGIERACSNVAGIAECAIEFYENGCVDLGDRTALDECVNGNKNKRADGEQLIKVTATDNKMCLCIGKLCNNKDLGIGGGGGGGGGDGDKKDATTTSPGDATTALAHSLTVNIQLVFCLSVLATRWVWVINKE